MIARTELARQLERNFGGNSEERRVVARQAGDLSDSGVYEGDTGRELTNWIVIENLRDAPDELSIAAKWNWWLGALDLAYGGYEEFEVACIQSQ